MKKRSTLLKVLSIILIVLGAFSLISSIIAVAAGRMVPEETYASLGVAAPTTFSYILSFVGSFIFLISGIMGIVYKSKQSVLIMGILLAVYYIFNIIYSATIASFSALSLIDLIFPILYLWGWYQSN
ncbi:hypothetical protein [Muricomes intestini]|jgi:hypothetical protein|uniref:DUF4064 domain-containing protein n=1 Tax=Muricomes intestini TaxID=1796634 RepID=A0A4R3KGF3_9FIRM|nr:hypothetical protein [Muricomes intestini]TCS81741.1 hypothetical protein EDD59_103162 [Muricomes intestini]